MGFNKRSLAIRCQLFDHTRINSCLASSALLQQEALEKAAVERVEPELLFGVVTKKEHAQMTTVVRDDATFPILLVPHECTDHQMPRAEQRASFSMPVNKNASR